MELKITLEMDPTQPPYWFRAKRYGWGWGFPATWQGWVVMIIWLLALIANALLLSHNITLFVLLTVALSAVLFAICYAKGEPPRWRWGD
jgi:hypothetical protein